jgi:serine/threonine protein kinase
MDILPRELQQKFQILGEPLGEGGMGAVYKARHLELERLCVIKVIQAHLQNNPDVRQRFLGEAKKGAQIIHPNIAMVMDFFVGSNGTACLVMEYIDGDNLRDILEKHDGPLGYAEAVAISIQALAALACLHSKNIVHRDISPDNLMLTNEAKRVVKVIDLGIAKSLEEGSAVTGYFIGKWAYAPPEQFRKKVDARSDIYSMGVVLYRLLTKTFPIAGKSFESFYAAHRDNVQPQPFSVTDPAGRVPESIRRLVLKALEKNPDARYQTADEFREALERSLTSAESTVREEPVPPTPKPKRRTSVMLSVVAAILVIILAVLRLMGPSAAVRLPSQPSSLSPAGTDITVTGTQQSSSPPGSPGVLDPTSARAEVSLGEKLAASGNITGAYAAYHRATAADPSSAFAWANLGAAAAILGKPDEAMKSYQRSLTADPANWLAHYNLGCLLARTGRRDEAFDHLSRAVQQMRLNAKSQSQLDSFIRSVRTDEALKDLRDDPRFDALQASN